MDAREPLRFGAAFWLGRTDWPSLRHAVLAAETAGFDSIWVDDHLLSDEGDPTAPKLEGWATLAAIAALTHRATVGHLVTANTFRNPGLTAKLAVTLDHVSNGRALLGLGAGWFEREHDAFGIEFGASTGARLDRLAEAAGIIRRLLDGERVDHVGPAYRLHDAVVAPRPVQARLPIVIGGSGPRKTLPVVARLADGWNAYGEPAELGERDAVLAARCRDIGRDPASIERSTNHNVVIRDDPAAATAVWERYRREHDPEPGEDRLLAGGPPELVADALRPYLEVGFRHHIWVFRSPWDLETIGRLGEVRAALGP